MLFLLAHHAQAWLAHTSGIQPAADVVAAMGLAGLVNLSMLLIAASLFFDSPLQATDTIEGAYEGFNSLVGPEAGLAFALALLASGMSSSSVGTSSSNSSSAKEKTWNLF